MRTLIVFGNITFSPDAPKAFVHGVENVIIMPDVQSARIVGEELVTHYDGYIIPSEFKGEIIWENGENL